MSRRGYHRFPYRTFFRWLGLLFCLALIPGAPLLWWLYWGGFRKTNIDALNSSASYAHDPGAAEAATWHVAEQWPWFLLAAVILFLFYYLVVFRWASPKYKGEPKESHY
jgi:hypothetical protein